MAIPALAIPALIEVGIKVLDKIFPDPEGAAKAKLALFELNQKGELAALAAETDIATAQAKINEVEAASLSPFRANWRPAVGWVCVVGLAYQFLIRPLLILGLVLGNITMDWSVLNLDMETLLVLLFGILGLGYFRTQEKMRGIS